MLYRTATAAIALAILAMACIPEARADGADYSGKNLANQKFADARLENANFEGTVLTQTNLSHAILTGANFRSADCNWTSFQEADLSKADFRNARFNFPTFQKCNLSDANFEGGDLAKAPLYNCNLRRANLRNVKSLGIISRCDLVEADLRGANFRQMKDDTQPSNFYKAKYDRTTLWPDGFDPVAQGAVLVESAPAPRQDPPAPPRTNDNVPAGPNDAAALLQVRRFADAEAAFRQILATRPSDIEALSGLAQSLGGQNRAAEAAQAYRRLAAIQEQQANRLLPDGGTNPGPAPAPPAPAPNPTPYIPAPAPYTPAPYTPAPAPNTPRLRLLPPGGTNPGPAPAPPAPAPNPTPYIPAPAPYTPAPYTPAPAPDTPAPMLYTPAPSPPGGGQPASPLTAETSPAPASMADGKPQGLYFMTRYWSYTHTLEKAAWYFAPSGEAYENIETGFSPQELAAHKRRHGTFQVTGNSMEIRWSDGKTSKSPVERDGSSFAWDMGIFTPVEPLPGAASIAGVYEGGESLSHGGNRVAVAKKLTLRADGTFEWEGIALTRGETPFTILYAGSEGRTTRGTWQAGKYSITLNVAGGGSFRQIAFPFDDKAASLHPARVFFGGMMYKKLAR